MRPRRMRRNYLTKLTMERGSSIEITRGQDWELGVTKEFKQIVAENPDFIPILYQTIEKMVLLAVGEIIENKGVKVEKIQEKKRSTVYRVDFENHCFAVKIARNDYLADLEPTPIARGFDEFDSSYSAQKIIENNEELKKLGVRIIPFQAGFTEKFSYRKHTFFVSEWKKDNWVSLKDKMWPKNFGNLDKKDKRVLKALEMRIHKISSVLETKCGFIDMNEVNAFYDNKTDEIILYDLFQKKQST